MHDLPRVDVAGVHWRPVRRTLGISAFGINAYSGDAGEHVVEPHTERESGHEELYLVISGAATFRVNDEVIDAPQGTMIFVEDPSDHREATATVDATIIVALGGSPGAAGPVSAWEWRFAATSSAQEGDWEAAYATAARALPDHPDNAAVHYDLACYAARAGRPDDAFEHLRRASGDPRVAEWAAGDGDLDSLRDDPRFAATFAVEDT